MRSRLRMLAPLAAAALAALTPGRAVAAWPHDPSVNVLASSTTVYGGSPIGQVSDGAGGVIVAWVDNRAGYEVYAQRTSSAGAPEWTPGGVLVSTGSGGALKGSLVATSDGGGGILIAWADSRNGNADIYAQRVTGSGAIAAGWAASGVRLSTLGVDDGRPQIVSDGAGGAIVAYVSFYSGSDYDIYAQHVNASGAIPAGWNPSFGAPVCIIVGIEDNPQLSSDGAGGAIITWEDDRSGTNYDIYAARITSAGALPWAVGGVVVDASVNDQRLPVITSDGNGGAIITWEDRRSGSNLDVYALRLTASGTNAVGWTFSVPICTASDDDQPTAIVTDGSGGALIAMSSRRSGVTDIYLQHVTGAGSVAAGWPNASIGGVAACAAAGVQDFPSAISDGAGGAILAWRDARYNGNSYDVFATRITGSGSPAAGWVADGVPVCIANGDQYPAQLCSDGSGGAIISWGDNRNAPAYGVYAQRIDRFGDLGNAEPSILQVKDVPNDQGGSVKLSWSASYLDNDPQFGIANYWIWRSVPGSIANAAIAAGRGVLAEDGVAPRPGTRTFRTTTLGATTYSWEYVGSQVAQAFASYSMVVSTTSDSMSGSNPYTVLMVEAKPPSGNAYWTSAPDSGYSVDNVSPATPAPFTGEWLRDRKSVV